MNDRIDELASEFIEIDNFYTYIPENIVEEVKKEIKPIFEKEYVTSQILLPFKDLIFVLFENEKSVTNHI